MPLVTAAGLVFPESTGPDIHKTYQKVTNWDALPKYDLFIIKVTEGKGAKWLGSKDYIDNMRRIGYKWRGYYHWLRSDSTALEQADNMTRYVRDVMGGLQDGEFLMYDWETTPDIPACPLSLVQEFINIMEQRFPGRGMVYASDWVPYFQTWRRSLQGVAYPLCYANYNRTMKPTGGYPECQAWRADVWQWTSTHPRPTGMTGNGLDMNEVLNPLTLNRISNIKVAKPPTPQVPPASSTPPSTDRDDEDMDIIITNSDVMEFEGKPQAAKTVKWRKMEDGTIRHLDWDEYRTCYGAPEQIARERLTDNETLAKWPVWAPLPGTPAAYPFYEAYIGNVTLKPRL